MTGPGFLWGGRFAELTAASTLAFTAFLFFDHRLWSYDI